MFYGQYLSPFIISNLQFNEVQGDYFLHVAVYINTAVYFMFNMQYAVLHRQVCMQ